METTLERRPAPPVDVAGRYTRTSIETADQLTLVTMLYDGLIRFLASAREKMKKGQNAHEDCIRARDIAHHLLHSTVDDGSDLSKNIRSLCFHMYRETILADMEKSAARIDDILPVAQSLRSGWAGLKKVDGDRKPDR